MRRRFGSVCSGSAAEKLEGRNNLIDKDWSCRVAEVREVNVVVSVVLRETNQKSSIYTFLHHKGRTRELVLREHMAYPHYSYS